MTTQAEIAAGLAKYDKEQKEKNLRREIELGKAQGKEDVVKVASANLAKSTGSFSSGGKSYSTGNVDLEKGTITGVRTVSKEEQQASQMQTKESEQRSPAMAGSGSNSAARSETAIKTLINEGPAQEKEEDPRMVTRTAVQKIRTGTGEQFLYYDNGMVKRVKTNPVAEAVRQGGSVKFARGSGGRPELIEFNPPPNAKPIMNAAGEVTGYEFQESSPYVSAAKGVYATAKESGSKFDQAMQKIRKEGEKLEIEAARKRAEGKLGYFESAAGGSLEYIADSAQGFKEVIEKPTPWAVAGGLTLLATKSPKLAYTVSTIGSAVLPIYAYSELKQIGEGKKSAAKSLGEAGAYYTIAKVTYGLKDIAQKQIANIRNFEYKMQFNKLQSSLQAKGQPYVNYEGIEGPQRDLYGKSISDADVRYSLEQTSQYKVGYGIEENTLKPGKSDYLPTGQTKLAHNKIVAVDRAGQISDVRVSGSQPFVYDSGLKKYVEYNPDKFKLVTVNPKYNLKTVLQDNKILVLGQKPEYNVLIEFRPQSPSTASSVQQKLIPASQTGKPSNVLSSLYGTKAAKAPEIKMPKIEQPAAQAVAKTTAKPATAKEAMTSILPKAAKQYVYFSEEYVKQGAQITDKGIEIFPVEFDLFGSSKPAPVTKSELKTLTVNMPKASSLSKNRQEISAKYKPIDKQESGLKYPEIQAALTGQGLRSGLRSKQGVSSIQIQEQEQIQIPVQDQLQEVEQIQVLETTQAGAMQPMSLREFRGRSQTYEDISFKEPSLLNMKFPKKGGMQGFNMRMRPVKVKALRRYTPTTYAAVQHIKSPKITGRIKAGEISGLGVRPVIEKSRKKKRGKLFNF